MSQTPQSTGARLADIAREVQSGTDVTGAAASIVEAALELVPQAIGAGVTLVRRRGKVETEGASSDLVRAGDSLQYELGEGPCLQAAWEQPLVHATDLHTDDRWPRWAARVVELGVRSMLCAQLFTNDDQLGALNVYATDPDAFDDEDVELVRLLAAHAAVGVASAQQIQTLKVAVDSRTAIGKAIGILMVRFGLDDDAALQVLRRWSSHQNRKLHDVAVDVVLEQRAVPTPTLVEPSVSSVPVAVRTSVAASREPEGAAAS